MIELSGLFAPLVTPFTDDGGTISEARFARLMVHLLDSGIEGFMVGGDAGEYLALSYSERKLAVELAMRSSQGRPVIANVSSLSTMSSLDMAQHCARHGARGVVVTPPYYGTYSDEEIAGFFESIAHHANTTVIVVDPTERIDQNLEDRLSKLPNLEFAMTLSNGGKAGLAFKGRRTFNDEFAISKAAISPLALLNPQAAGSAYRLSTREPHALSDFANKIPTPKLCKAALDLRGIETGPPRAPMQRLPLAELQGSGVPQD